MWHRRGRARAFSALCAAGAAGAARSSRGTCNITDAGETLTALRVLDNPAAVGTVVEAAVPLLQLLRFPRLAQVHDVELVRLGVGLAWGWGKARCVRRE